MKFRLRALTLALKREDVLIPFSDVTYFYGQMGAGKTSIARLVDYCLGGEIELSPALQSELVGVTLEIQLARTVLYLERPRESDRLIAEWHGDDGPYNVSIPAREASGEVIPGTGVENLSDLLFWLSDVTPPKVRKSKTKDNTELGRLSIRDLLWYCYLDQDTIDSGFFHLDESANPFKRLKSRDVLRFIIGFHQERVAQLEAELDSLRVQKQMMTARIEALVRALNEVGVGSEGELRLRVETLLGRAESIERELHRTGDQLRTEYITHASERLREDALRLSAELISLDESIREIHVQIAQARRHLLK